STHDTPLAQKLWPHLHKGDVLLGDRAFGDFVTMALQPLRGVAAPGTHPEDFGKLLKLLAPEGAIFLWKKLVQRPGSISEARWRQVLEQASVRVMRSRLVQPGFWTQVALVATTLLDPEHYPAAEIAEVCQRRWRIEPSFRDIRTSMEPEHLHAESPEIAAKELLAGRVACNLVRATMIEAACRHGARMDRLSLNGTLDGLRHYGLRMAHARSPKALRRLRRGLFNEVARDLLPKRLGRREPRTIKRQPKPCAYLIQPRHLYREIPHRSRWNPVKSKAPALPHAPDGSAIWDRPRWTASMAGARQRHAIVHSQQQPVGAASAP
ncbi:MAG: transposase, partial [Verrucomicrobiota bacterium]